MANFDAGLHLAHAISAMLQESMLGSGLIAHVPHATGVTSTAGMTAGARSAASGIATSAGAAVERISLAFPSPLLVPFRALYTRLRLLLGGPTASE